MYGDIDQAETAPREHYTHGHHESVLRTHAWRTVDNSAAYLAPSLVPGLQVLDVGSGPGTITVDLARRVAPGRVVGVDASEQIVGQAAGLAVSEGVANAEFRVGNAYALDFPDASFDVVHAHQVLQHLGRPVDALHEFRRVLRPGGLLAVRDVDYGGALMNPGHPMLDRWLELIRIVQRWNGGEADAGRRVAGWVRAAGFEHRTPSASTWLFTTPAEREWWGGSWAERATDSQFAADAIESGHSDPAELRAISEAWRAWVRDEDGWFLMPHGEVLARS